MKIFVAQSESQSGAVKIQTEAPSDSRAKRMIWRYAPSKRSVSISTISGFRYNFPILPLTKQRREHSTQRLRNKLNERLLAQRRGLRLENLRLNSESYNHNPTHSKLYKYLSNLINQPDKRSYQTGFGFFLAGSTRGARLDC